MRGAIGRRINGPNNFFIPNVAKNTAFSLQSSSSFCSGSGRGRGRGAPSDHSQFDIFSPTKPPGQPTTESKPESPQLPPDGRGHGRGIPSGPPSSLPGFSSFLSAVKSGAGRGRGSFTPDPSESARPDPSTPKPGTFTPTESAPDSTQPSEPSLPSSILSVLPGAGRGKTDVKQQQPVPAPRIKEENRHIRAQSRPRPGKASEPAAGPAHPKLSREDAVKMAMKVLSRGIEGEGEGVIAGGRGRGRGQGRGRGRGRGRGGDRMRRMEMEDEDERFGSGLYLGDNADGEKLAEKLGVENMNMLVEGFEEMSSRVLPSPLDDAYIDAFDTNCMVSILTLSLLLLN